jgi:hypothetical protein
VLEPPAAADVVVALAAPAVSTDGIVTPGADALFVVHGLLAVFATSGSAFNAFTPVTRAALPRHEVIT